jgi:ribosomal protein S8
VRGWGLERRGEEQEKSSKSERELDKVEVEVEIVITSTSWNILTTHRNIKREESRE